MLELQQHIDMFHQAVSESGNRFANDLRTHLADPLLDAVDDILKSVQVLEAIDLNAPEGVSRDAILAVTRALQTEFLPAYGKLLSSSKGLTLLADGFKTWSTDVESASDALPEVLTRPEPEALYAASAKDSVVQRSRKSMVRMQRKLMEKDASHGQNIPLHDIGKAYSRVWLPIQFGKVIDDDRRRMAQALSSIEQHTSIVFHLALQCDYRLALRDLSDGNSTEEKPLGPILEAFSAALQSLKQVLTESPPRLRPVSMESVRERLERAWIPLETQIEQSDSFLSAIPSASSEDLAIRITRLAGNADAWEEWLQRLKVRHAYLSELLTFRFGIDELAEVQSRALSHRIGDYISEAVRTTSTRLEDVSSRTQALFSGPDSSLFDKTESGLNELSDAGTHAIQTNFVAPIQELAPVSCLSEEAVRFLEGLAALREELHPDFRMHPMQDEATDRIHPEADARVLNLRELAQKAAEELNEDRLEALTKSCRNGLRDLVEDAGELPSILSFSFQSVVEGQGSRDSEKDDGKDSGAEIALGGISRTIAAMKSIESKAGEEIDAASKAMHIEAIRAWGRLHERVRVEHQVGGYVLDVKSKLDSEARQIGRQVARQLREAKVLAERFLRRGQRQAKDLIEKGKEAVGSPSVTRASFHETAVGLAELEAVLNSVPPVYRKLFSFQPLSDPELLIGRSDGITFVKNQLEQFEMGTPQATILVGGPSSGRTSLLNVVRTTLLVDRDVRSLQLNEKVESSSEILELFRSKLGLSLPDNCALDEAADLILDMQYGEAQPPICIVEHLEALMLRGIGGYRLLSDVLKFMSRTDTRIIWISTVSSFGWQLMSTSDPVAAALVNRFTMNELGRADLERLIMERHKKSGVPIEFVQPDDLNPLLRRRLRRVRSKEMKQELLKEAFFDRLYSQFGQNIQMALLQWVRSVEMEGDSERMQVRMTQPLNLTFFSGFQLDQVFAMKALLEHGHLSIAEYAAIDRITYSQAMSIFETLGNALVIEAVESDNRSTLFRHVAVRSGISYRIRPLFTHAAIRLLKERNVVH